MESDVALQGLSRDWLIQSAKYQYSYHFSWLGLPIIQLPQDILAVQEIIWAVKPDLIVETGIARGGSLILSASLLELLGGEGLAVGVDVDIRESSRLAIESHPLAHRVRMIEGSSTSPQVMRAVEGYATGRDRIMVLLDSNHAHDHVLRELELYSSLVKPGGYIIVFDTLIERMPPASFPDRPWDIGNNPATAVRAFLEQNHRFEVDHAIEQKLLISVAPGGYLRCIA